MMPITMRKVNSRQIYDEAIRPENYEMKSMLMLMQMPRKMKM